MWNLVLIPSIIGIWLLFMLVPELRKTRKSRKTSMYMYRIPDGGNRDKPRSLQELLVKDPSE
jgi:ABC-type phosphate transport system permease subunit